jgi:hypothetical protein
MKIAIASLMILLASCSGSETKEPVKMTGAYKMVSSQVKSATTDTTYTNGEQMKIFTDDFMMYAYINSPDSVSSFGIGSYTASGDTITENVLFNANDSMSNNNPGSFTLMISKTEKGYSQAILGMKNNAGEAFDLTETYESAGSTAASPIDGTWKLVKRMSIKGTDTVSNSATQYKTYGSGHVIWGHHGTDSLNKGYTGLGFGTFTLNGTKMKESMQASTYHDVRGKDFDIEIEMMGTDGFKQTMVNADGSRNIEIYERLKK